MHAHIELCMYICMIYIWMHICRERGREITYIYIYICIYAYGNRYTCVCTYMCVYTYIYIYVHTHMYIYIYIYVHMRNRDKNRHLVFAELCSRLAQEQPTLPKMPASLESQWIEKLRPNIFTNNVVQTQHVVQIVYTYTYIHIYIWIYYSVGPTWLT